MSGSSREPSSLRRRAGCAALVVALALGAGGHWAYWYRPRAHALAPASSQLLREAAGSSQAASLPIRLWLPYPHQNLGALGGAVGQPREVLSAASRLVGLPELTIPQLGAFGTPAARELLIAASRDGQQVRAAVRLYPLAAVATRLAGMLASNSWLAGGEVELHGRPARVSWDGLTWRLESGSLAGASVAATSATATAGEVDAAPALALVDLAVASPPWPAGRYALRREGADLVWRLGPALAAPPSAGPPPRVILVWVERHPASAGGSPHEQALLLMEGGREGLLASLPAAAAWARPEGAIQLLPGGNLLRQLTDVRAAPFGGGELAATERAATSRAEELAATWLPLADGSSQPPIALGGWLAIDPAAAQAEALHRLLDEVPILGAAETQRWGDIALVLRAAHRYRTLSCWLAADGGRGELRLAR